MGSSDSGSLIQAAPLLIVLCAIAGAPTGALAASVRLAPKTLAVPVRGVALSVPVSGDLTYATRDGTAVVDGKLQADLAAAQKQSTALLRALIDRDSSCGDRIKVHKAQIGARAPALRVTGGTVNYRRTVCLAGRQMTVFPDSPIHIDMLLHPVIQSRSLRLRAEVLEVRATGSGIPAFAEAPLKETLGRVISQRIGELFPTGGVPADATLRTLSFAEVGRGTVVARIELSGSLPQPTLDRLIGRR